MPISIKSNYSYNKINNQISFSHNSLIEPTWCVVSFKSKLPWYFLYKGNLTPTANIVNIIYNLINLNRIVFLRGVAILNDTLACWEITRSTFLYNLDIAKIDVVVTTEKVKACWFSRNFVLNVKLFLKRNL